MSLQERGAHVVAKRGSGHKKCPACGKWGRLTRYDVQKALTWRLETFAHEWDDEPAADIGLVIRRNIVSCSVKIALCRRGGCKMDKGHRGGCMA